MCVCVCACVCFFFFFFSFLISILYVNIRNALIKKYFKKKKKKRMTYMSISAYSEYLSIFYSKLPCLDP